jgi:hypothetical protein
MSRLLITPSLTNSKFTRADFNSLSIIDLKFFFKSNLSEPKSLFQIASKPIRIEAVDIRYNKFPKNPICPLIFKNAKITTIFNYYQINTFYKRNYLKFSQINNDDINCSIETLWTYDNENIDIDSTSFLNKYIFHKVKKLALWGEINSIEKDTFKPFKDLKSIYLDIIFFGKLSRKGTEWISSIYRIDPS